MFYVDFSFPEWKDAAMTNGPNDVPADEYQCRGCAETYDEDGTQIRGKYDQWCSPECYRSEDCVCGCCHGAHEGGLYRGGFCDDCLCCTYVGDGEANGEAVDPGLLERTGRAGSLDLSDVGPLTLPDNSTTGTCHGDSAAVRPGCHSHKE